MTSQDDLTPEDARTYLAKKDLFQLFEVCLFLLNAVQMK